MNTLSFKIRLTTALICITLLALANGAIAKPITLKVTEGAPNLVSFTSIAPLETIVGKTSAISGSINFDPENLSGTIDATLEVDMATLDTDNKIRDGHMRKNHLHTDSFPSSQFTLHLLNGTPATKLQDGVPTKFNAKGTFLCHGVTKNIEPEVTATWNQETRSLSVSASFNVKLSEYDIPRPQFLVMKLDETQAVSVKFTAR